MATPQVDLFIPCFVDQMYPETGFSMVKVLEKLGCQVNYNPNQTCCGQPAFNAGFFEDAEEVALKFLEDFKGDRYIVAPSASCVGMVRNSYERFFRNSTRNPEFQQLKARTFEFTEFLTDVLNVNQILGARLDGVATYHDSCSGLRECRIGPGPRKLLSGVHGLKLIEMGDTNMCCGFGGTFAVKFESISIGMAAQKVDNAMATGANYIVSTDSSCLMHLQGYIDHQKYHIKCMHIADVLASGW